VQEDQCGLGLVTGVEEAGANAAGVEIALGERHALEIAPDAFVVGHAVTPRTAARI
jgi:hypothetical protein